MIQGSETREISQKTAWIAVDWGTSNLRVWAMDAENNLLAERSSERGMGELAPEEFESALLAIIDDFLSDDRIVPVICCGMVGARQGWAEAKYVPVPCHPPSGALAIRVRARDPRFVVFILPGVKQMKPADVMRGEETQILGFLSENPKFDGVLCLPGTHTKWVRISAEEIVSFQTFMTGELYALLSRQSVLRHSVAASGWDDQAFEEAIGEAMSRPEAVSAKLFSLRAETLVAESSGIRARARLSGLLIGLEIAASRPYWLGQNVAVIGAPEVCEVYRKAIVLQGLDPIVQESKLLTRNGLITAYESLRQAASNALC